MFLKSGLKSEVFISIIGVSLSGFFSEQTFANKQFTQEIVCLQVMALFSNEDLECVDSDDILMIHQGLDFAKLNSEISLKQAKEAKETLAMLLLN